MTRKTFTTSIAVLSILSAMALVTLYMTLGRMRSAIDARHGKTRPAAGAATVPVSEGGERSLADQLAAQGLEGMTLTPAGQVQLEQLGRAAAPQSTPQQPLNEEKKPRKASGPPAQGD